MLNGLACSWISKILSKTRVNYLTQLVYSLVIKNPTLFLWYNVPSGCLYIPLLGQRTPLTPIMATCNLFTSCIMLLISAKISDIPYCDSHLGFHLQIYAPLVHLRAVQDWRPFSFLCNPGAKFWFSLAFGSSFIRSTGCRRCLQPPTLGQILRGVNHIWLSSLCRTKEVVKVLEDYG